MKTFHSYLFFTRAKLTGYFFYEGLFQIYPILNEGVPTSEHQEHFPNFIEFFTTPEDELSLQTPFPELDDFFKLLRGPNIKKELILLLLTTGTNHLFFSYPPTKSFWGIPLDKYEELKIDESLWCIPAFASLALRGLDHITEFSKQDIKPVEKIKSNEYFFGTINTDLHFDLPITIPSLLEAFIESYFSLAPDDREVINNAMMHLKNGVEIVESKKTMSLLSLFTCLETMVSLEYKSSENQTCNGCNRPIFSVTKKFREFLTKYVSKDEMDKKKFNKLYELRSSIVHFGNPLESEVLFSDIPFEQRGKESLQVREVCQICRVAIVNWVISKTLQNLRDSFIKQYQD